MEPFSALLALCAGISPVTGEFPAQRPVTRSFDIFFHLRLNKRLNKQSWGWWFETPLPALWLHCNATTHWYKWQYFIIDAHHDAVIKWKHLPLYWPFVRWIHRSPVNTSHKDQWRGALMFSLICSWINGWVNNREAGDLKRHCPHCEVIGMQQRIDTKGSISLLTPTKHNIYSSTIYCDCMQIW